MTAAALRPPGTRASFLLTSGQGWLVETDVADAPEEDRRIFAL